MWGGWGVGFSPHCVFSSRFHSELEMCWGTPLCVRVFACVWLCVCAAGFKPFSGPFFLTVRVEPPLRSGDFSVCWCAITWYHITVGWRTSRGIHAWIAIETLNVCAQSREAMGDKRRRDKSLGNYFYVLGRETEPRATAWVSTCNGRSAQRRDSCCLSV